MPTWWNEMWRVKKCVYSIWYTTMVSWALVRLFTIHQFDCSCFLQLFVLQDVPIPPANSQLFCLGMLAFSSRSHYLKSGRYLALLPSTFLMFKAMLHITYLFTLSLHHTTWFYYNSNSNGSSVLCYSWA